MNYTNSDQDDLTPEQLELLAREASELLQAAAERAAWRELTRHKIEQNREPQRN